MIPPNNSSKKCRRPQPSALEYVTKDPSLCISDAIGDPAVADAVLDRIVHTAHRIELTGESVRKMKLKK